MQQKKITTLVGDIYSVIKGQGGWDAYIAGLLGDEVSELSKRRFSKPEAYRTHLSMSGIGAPCKRRLWYKINNSKEAKGTKASDLLKFFFGDLIESLILNLAKAAGHKVTGEQTKMEINGLKGSRDAVIDGMTIDVKSASPIAFMKFKKGNLRQKDSFGYISQLSSYVAAGKDDPEVTDKTNGAFLVVNKVTGEILLDVHDFTKDIEDKAKEIQAVKDIVYAAKPPSRLDPVPQYKDSSNLKLCATCGYCEFKVKCWPEMRTFVYSSGLQYLVEVNQEPRVPEYSYDKPAF
jgi:hypothetical protein|tara:strand:- start:1180 stop:2052 length:873 start_codon:yes stop_codon:yes gene_type:complete